MTYVLRLPFHACLTTNFDPSLRQASKREQFPVVYRYALAQTLRVHAVTLLVRFEGLPGEFSQHDFGEVWVTYQDGIPARPVPIAACAGSFLNGISRSQADAPPFHRRS